MTFQRDDGYVFTSPVAKFKANAFGPQDVRAMPGGGVPTGTPRTSSSPWERLTDTAGPAGGT